MVFLTVNDTGHAMLTRNDSPKALGALQTIVDGLVDCVSTTIDGFDFDVWVNDEGMFREDFRVNLPLTMLLGRQIVGPAAIAMSDADGRTVGLDDPRSEHAADALAAVLAGMGCGLCVLEEIELPDGNLQRTAYEVGGAFDPEGTEGTLVLFSPWEARMTCSMLSASAMQDNGLL